jgi:hypothetical protein
MTVFYHNMRLLVLASIFAATALALSGCIGGPIAQQLVSSLVTRGMDKIANNAYDAKQRDEKLKADRTRKLEDTSPDPYYFAFATSGFETISPVVEPLPASDVASADKKIGIATSIKASNGNSIEPPNMDVPNPHKQNKEQDSVAASIKPPTLQTTRLVRVEIWNLVVGDEKNRILEKARLLGEPLPSREEWKNWKVATGAAENSKEPITFMIPPHLGSIRSGDRAVVEITESDQLYMARYAAK